MHLGSGLRQFLESKAESAGREIIAVPAHYTSQKCSQCGEYVQKSLSVRTHVCPFCGSIADRDENAARNILHIGLQVLARTEPSLLARGATIIGSESPLSPSARSRYGCSPMRSVTARVARTMALQRYIRWDLLYLL